LKIRIFQILILMGLLGVWEGGTRIPSVVDHIPILDPFFVSRPSKIVERLIFLSSSEVKNNVWKLLGSTVVSTLLGFFTGVSTGFAAGLSLGRSRFWYQVLSPYIITINSLPRIALVPLITMVFGFGLMAKVVMAWLIVFFIVFFNTFQGAKSVDQDLVFAAKFLGASKFQVLKTVIIPSTLAWTFASLTPSISFALIGVVIGEFIGGESGGGIGYLIVSSLATLNSADMMVALILLATVGYILAFGIQKLEARLLRWRPEYVK